MRISQTGLSSITHTMIPPSLFIPQFLIHDTNHNQVHDSRPQALRPNFTDLSSVEKYEMNAETYENLSDSVLAWKRNQKLGRFDPNALSPEDSLRKQVEKDKAEIARRGKQSKARRRT